MVRLGSLNISVYHSFGLIDKSFLGESTLSEILCVPAMLMYDHECKMCPNLDII